MSASRRTSEIIDLTSEEDYFTAPSITAASMSATQVSPIRESHLNAGSGSGFVIRATDNGADSTRSFRDPSTRPALQNSTFPSPTMTATSLLASFRDPNRNRNTVKSHHAEGSSRRNAITIPDEEIVREDEEDFGQRMGFSQTAPFPLMPGQIPNSTVSPSKALDILLANMKATTANTGSGGRGYAKKTGSSLMPGRGRKITPVPLPAPKSRITKASEATELSSTSAAGVPTSSLTPSTGPATQPLDVPRSSQPRPPITPSLIPTEVKNTPVPLPTPRVLDRKAVPSSTIPMLKKPPITEPLPTLPTTTASHLTGLSLGGTIGITAHNAPALVKNPDLKRLSESIESIEPAETVKKRRVDPRSAGDGDPKTTAATSSQSITAAPRNTPPSVSYRNSYPSGQRPLEKRRFTEEEDQRLIYLKDDQKLSWSQIGQHFPDRTINTLQVRWCTKLSKRNQTLPASRSTLRHAPLVTDPTEVAGMHVQTAQQPIFRKTQPEILASIERDSRVEIRERPMSSAPRKEPRRPDGFLEQRVMERHRNAAALTSLTSVLTSGHPSGVLVPRPYLSTNQREVLSQSISQGYWDNGDIWQWEGRILHVGMHDEELKKIKRGVQQALALPKSGPLSQSIANMVRGKTQEDLERISRHIRAKSGLKGRTEDDLVAFLQDAASYAHSQGDRYIRLAVKGRLASSDKSVGEMLRDREVGVQTRGRIRHTGTFIPSELVHRTLETMGPSISFTGTSHDVLTVAWAPNGDTFAAGSACLEDPDSMQYNRPNNLMLGSVDDKVLRELPDHHVARSGLQPEKGVNSLHSMQMTQDPRVFTTVSSVQFSPDGALMYTAGYDCRTLIWDVSRGVRSAKPVLDLKHKAKVDLLAVSPINGLLATGARRAESNSVKVIDCSETAGLGKKVASYSSHMACKRPEMKITPTSLRWGVTPVFAGFLLAGFGSNSNERRDTLGETCVWDVESGTQWNLSVHTRNVFDIAWNPARVPLHCHFAVGAVAGQNANKGANSIIRAYHVHQTIGGRFGSNIECECPAMDINDVVFNPYDDNYISASCTDDKIYVYDFRNPDDPVHVLQHDESLQPCFEPYEANNTGVRFTSYGHDRRHLYTGSSDGVVKLWDIYRSPEDAWTRDLVSLNSGVMSGAFSSDNSRLILGEVNGTINILQVGNSDRLLREMDNFTLLEAPETKDLVKKASSTEAVDLQSGIQLSRKMVESGEIKLKPMGSLPIRQAVQGPNYNGPFDQATNAETLRKRAERFQAKFQPPTQVPERNSKEKMFTAEELGDSKRSQDRIPFTLTHPPRPMSNSTLSTMVTTLGRCVECGKPARARLVDPGTLEPRLLCENCGFSCFRCGQQCSVTGSTPKELAYISCKQCNRTWRANALGYQIVRGVRDNHEKVEKVTKLSSDQLLGESLDDYYNELWEVEKFSSRD